MNAVRERGTLALWAALLVASAAGAAGGCRREEAAKTGIVVELHSEYAIPAQIDRLHITVTGLTAGGEKQVLSRDFELGTGVGSAPVPPVASRHATPFTIRPRAARRRWAPSMAPPRRR